MKKCSKEEFLHHLFAEFEARQLDYFVLGEYRSLPNDTGGSDVDIVASVNDTKEVLNQVITVALEKGAILASHYYNSHTEMFRFINDDWGVQIDVLKGGVFYKGIEYYPYQILKKHVISYNGIRVVEEQFGFYVDFFKEIIYKAKAKEKYCVALLQVLTNDENNVRQNIESCYSVEVWDLITHNRSVDQLNNVGKCIHGALLRSLSTRGTLVTNILYDIKRFHRFFQPNPGYVIVVEGTDGSGKSTIINGMIPWMNECFHKSVIYNHLRPHLLPDIGVLLGKRKGEEQIAVVDNPHAQKPSGFFGSVFRWFYYLHDYTWGYLLKVWPKIKTRSYVYVFDRYYYDYYIDSIRSRIVLPRWILRFGEIFVPKPDIILCLGGDPKQIYARKPETSFEEVNRQTEELKRFSTQRRNATWIDTTQSVDNSIADAKKAILIVMSNKSQNVKYEKAFK